ncbi:MAG: hypothetical protein QOD51_2984 [Candidatus Eremiobacteraeota bacterium]|jgi:hypothetical protein|nr:hypothetical protein [Candidatus Eremiobacteraeota bacterium]
MLVLVPTREDVLAIQSIEDAFDLTTTKINGWEVALIRVAEAQGLLEFPGHAHAAASDEAITENDVMTAIRSGRAASKDIDLAGYRKVGINFERTIARRRRIRVKVSWDRRHYTVTVHTI